MSVAVGNVLTVVDGLGELNRDTIQKSDQIKDWKYTAWTGFWFSF